MNRRLAQALLLALPLILSACLQSEELGGASSGHSEARPHGPRLALLNFPDTYVIVGSGHSWGTLMVRESPGEDRSTPKELFLRIVDANGTLHDREFDIPAIGPGAITYYPFDFEGPAPYLVTAECGCAFVWLDNPGRDPTIQMGDRALLQKKESRILLHYSHDNPSDILSKPPLSDEKQYASNASILHWGFFWNFNLRGNATLETPSGRELAHWETEGRFVADGHVSNGSTPLELGTWTLKLAGVGWFELYLSQTYLPPTAWATYGIKSPP